MSAFGEESRVKGQEATVLLQSIGEWDSQYRRLRLSIGALHICQMPEARDQLAEAGTFGEVSARHILQYRRLRLSIGEAELRSMNPKDFAGGWEASLP